MASYTDLSKGAVIKFKNEPHVVIFYQHYKPGKGPAFVRTKLKSLITGSVIEENFRGGDGVEFINVERQNLQYLYPGEGEYNFMRTDNYEQLSLSADIVGDSVKWVKEGQEIIGLFFEGKVVSIEIPKKVTMEIQFVEQAVRGDTASGTATKEAELETGAKIQVPLFIKQGEKIVINTETGQYVERA